MMATDVADLAAVFVVYARRAEIPPSSGECGAALHAMVDDEQFETRDQMIKLRFVFVALIALPLSPVFARAQAVPRSSSADFFLAGCKDYIRGATRDFFSGRCAGAVEVLGALNSETKRFCPPENLDNLQRVKVIVDYIEAHPERKKADFMLVANEAMANAWPCKK
jgi:hypothetical protein